MKLNEKPINEYLELICSLLIDQFNVRYEQYSKEEFKLEANNRYVERDWVYKIGGYFNDLAYYEVPDSVNTQSHNDISIPSKDFIIELKYIKNFNSHVGTKSGRTNWEAYKKDFDWLENQIISGKKGKRAFVIIWCNCLDYLGQAMQLGNPRSGKKPTVNKDRLVYFPFLMNNTTSTDRIYTKDLVYNYRKTFPCQLDLNTIGKGNIEMSCMFLGNEADRLHIAIYY